VLEEPEPAVAPQAVDPLPRRVEGTRNVYISLTGERLVKRPQEELKGVLGTLRGCQAIPEAHALAHPQDVVQPRAATPPLAGANLKVPGRRADGREAARQRHLGRQVIADPARHGRDQAGESEAEWAREGGDPGGGEAMRCVEPHEHKVKGSTPQGGVAQLNGLLVLEPIPLRGERPHEWVVIHGEELLLEPFMLNRLKLVLDGPAGMVEVIS